MYKQTVRQMENSTIDTAKVSAIATSLVKMANTNKWNQNTIYQIYLEKLARLLFSIKDNGGLAGEIATTVISSLDRAKGNLAFISSKQAFVLATAAVQMGLAK